ncbi:glycerol-3-phosphate acyltransferase 1, mitochondrial [Caerostris extrusa]|uniref:Glycerol-3-phosphate acyltransferase 1, mitochondrial n=1 Tax=Caerostris extrusa TaxID=172846 RepID=A0AAV4TB37_CAEEX|nr:glycerol-3-phosphate acyltransferase 1, mitochondrial [Caerostris extrusa]
MQEVYKKWERKPNFTTRGRCRNLQQNSGNFSRVYGQDGYQFDNRMTVDRPGERRFKSRIRTPQFKLPKYDGLAQFKMTPCVVALNKERPFVGSCCLKCLPMSRASISDKSVFSLCICNILHIPRVQSFDFNSILNILKKTPNNSYPSVSMDVFKNERIQQAVEKVIEDCQKDVNFIDNEETGVVLKSKQYTRVKNIFESLKTSVSYTCIQ